MIIVTCLLYYDGLAIIFHFISGYQLFASLGLSLSVYFYQTVLYGKFCIAILRWYVN